MDVLAELEELALASRLRRLSESLTKDLALLYQDLGIALQPRWFPLFHALDRDSPRSITELAQALGFSHTAINQIAGQMIRAGLVRAARDPGDERRRLLSLSPRGALVLARLEPVWTEVRAAAREVLAESGSDLLDAIDRVERTLAERSIADRVRSRLSLPARGALEIVDYRPAYKKCFKALNEEWLRAHFTVEEHDSKVLNDPNGQILKRGGHVLFAVLDQRVVGTCALLPHRGDLLELCKMAVAPPARKRGIGTALVGAAIERARTMGASRLHLQTSPELKAAVRLYRRLGFRTIRPSPLPPPQHRGCVVAMRLDLTTSKPHAPATEECST
jgi:ribosomal protein S18 acetylase RimI-like enzyme/DNA-binding MarR family transcriptional regulator